MTVTVQTNKDTFTGDGTNAALATTFPFIGSGDLVVTKRVTATGVETTLTLSTHYTVTGGSGALGTVTVVDGATDFPSTVTWTITRATPQTQPTDYVANDDFGAQTHEDALDRVTMIAQDGVEKIDRSLRVAVTDVNPAVIPSSTLRASKHLAFDASGDPIVTGSPTDTALTTAFSETLLDDGDAATARATLDAQQDVITTRGDIVRGSSGAVAERLALGASASYLRSNGTDPGWFPLQAADVEAKQKLPRNYLAGCKLTRTDANTITVSVGEARNTGDGKNMPLAATLAKDIDATWAVGAGGGLNATDFASGSSDAEADTWYHVFLIRASGGNIDVGFDKSVVAANLLTDSGYTEYRRIGSVKTDSSRDIIDFVQNADGEFMYVTGQLDYSVDATDFTSGVTITLDMIPLGIATKALVRLMVDAVSAADLPFILQSIAETAAAPSISAVPLATVVCPGTGNAVSAEFWINVAAAQTVRGRMLTDSSIDVDILVKGWIDDRGRDD